MIRRVYEGLTWRWNAVRRVWYLRRNFRNGQELVDSYYQRKICDIAICPDDTCIQHPVNRIGFAGMLLEVWHEEVYTKGFYSPAPGDLIIDAGANIGLFSLLIARREPRCRILAFEPFEENYQYLHLNLASAGCSQVQHFPYALARHSGHSTIDDGGKRSQDHRLRADDTPDVDKPSVRTCSLSEIFELAGQDVIDMFKCDIEGSERELFAGAGSEQLSKIRRLAIEYHDNIRPGTLDLLLRRLNNTHETRVVSSGSAGYGMLYATRLPANAP